MALEVAWHRVTFFPTLSLFHFLCSFGFGIFIKYNFLINHLLKYHLQSQSQPPSGLNQMSIVQCILYASMLPLYVQYDILSFYPLTCYFAALRSWEIEERLISWSRTCVDNTRVAWYFPAFFTRTVSPRSTEKHRKKVAQARFLFSVFFHRCHPSYL